MTLDGVATCGYWKASEQARKATEVAGTVCAVAEGNVFDGFGLDARLLDRMADCVSSHCHGWGHVEPAAASLGESGADIRGEYCFAHGGVPFSQVLLNQVLVSGRTSEE